MLDNRYVIHELAGIVGESLAFLQAAGAKLEDKEL
jgi:hypothetical protein